MADLQTTRRSFLGQAAARGVGTFAAALAARLAGGEEQGVQPATAPAWDAAAKRPLNLGFIGMGAQGRTLLFDNCVKLKDHNARIQAVCDIWPYRRTYGERLCKKFKHDTRGYEHFAQMLEKEKGLDAVIIATPDWMHAEQTIACLEAGLHVYCETPMARRLDQARAMAKAARRAGRLLQIGYQRRSNPPHLLGLEYLRKHTAVGRITAVHGQWNRRGPYRHGSLPAQWIPDLGTLRKYGYSDVEQLLNWRYHAPFHAGPAADVGSPLLDVLDWFLDSHPSAVTASGYAAPDIPWPCDLTALVEWRTHQQGQVQAVTGTFQLLNTTSFGGYFVRLVGSEGMLEIHDYSKGTRIQRQNEVDVAQWEQELDKWAKGNVTGYQSPLAIPMFGLERDWSLDREYPLPVDMNECRPIHCRHLENFFAAIRSEGKVPLNCPPEVAYPPLMTALRLNESAAIKTRIEIKPEEYVVA